MINSKNTHVIDATKLERSHVKPGEKGESISEAKNMAINGQGIGTTTTFDFSENKLYDGTPNTSYSTIAHEVQHQYDFDQGKMGDHYDANGQAKKGSESLAEKRAVKNEDTARDQDKIKRREKY